jgi:hypothetical protein
MCIVGCITNFVRLIITRESPCTDTGLFTVVSPRKFNIMQHKIPFKTAPRFNF